MATNFKYALISDLTKHFTRINDYDDKRQIFPSSTSTNLHTFQNCGDVDTFFVNGEEQGAENTDTPNSNGEWKYDSNTNKLKEVAKIDYNLQSYIRKHTEVLMSVGNTEEEASSLIFNRLKEAVNTVEKEKAL